MESQINQAAESEDESHHSGGGLHCSQNSFASHQSHHSLRSRNNSDVTSDSNNPLGGGGGGAGGSFFFADMTLDLAEAQMETTPRTDMKFSALANREDIHSIPAMPLIEEPVDANNIGENSAADGEAEEFGAPSSSSFGKIIDHESIDATAEKNPAPSVPERSFARIESGASNTASGHSLNNASTAHTFPRLTRLPRRPRDVSWTAAALILLPVGLLLPHLYYSNGYIDRHNHHPCASSDDGGDGGDDCHPRHPSWSQTALSPSSHSTVLFSSLFATAVSFALVKLLYSHPGGGEGDDRRLVNVTRTLILASNLCVWLNPLLALAMWHWLPDCRGAALLPLGLMMRDGLRVKNSGSALPSFRSRLDGARSRRGAAGYGGMGGARSAPSSNDRKTFFRALAVASLDILSRSLRRKSFVRAASAVLLVQFVAVSLWWGSLSVVLSVQIFDEDSIVTKFMHAIWMLLALVAGKWATGTVARLLGFVASGGVASWFDKQTEAIEMMEREQASAAEVERRAEEQKKAQKEQQQPSSSANGRDAATEEKSTSAENSMDDLASGNTSDYAAAGAAAAKAALHAMPEAYRTADAAAYASVMDADEGLDDDYEEDHELGQGDADYYSNTSWHNQQQPQSSSTSSTVKSFLAAGCTISFGSVAQCGLLGGLAQFSWSVVRNVDAMGFSLQRRFSSGDSTLGFRGMDISVNGGGHGGPRQWKQTLSFWWRKLDVSIRGFVRSHSDLAMSHVAAYFKSYQRAANDVAVLIETSGVEFIIHDDITTHMCSSAGHLVAGSIVMVSGMLLVTHRNSFSSAPLADASLLEVLLFSYVLCYTILFTALEPLRAAIKAVYVCFAEHPTSLRRAFPLIYQRLSRISEVRQ